MDAEFVFVFIHKWARNVIPLLIACVFMFLIAFILGIGFLKG